MRKGMSELHIKLVEDCILTNGFDHYFTAYYGHSFLKDTCQIIFCKGFSLKKGLCK